jgi:anionic cell wall polymer biosynthesis LytR-Cps2A-Psr (LCP) family protein
VIDDFYPADLAGGNPYDYQRVAVLPGAQHMTGLQAMEYVRSRHGDLREDFGRSERQQQVLLALRVKAHQLGFADLPDIASSLTGQLTTDMSIREVANLLPLAVGLDLKNVQRILLLPPYTSSLTVGDQDALSPNWDLIRPMVAKTFP